VRRDYAGQAIGGFIGCHDDAGLARQQGRRLGTPHDRCHGYIDASYTGVVHQTARRPVVGHEFRDLPVPGEEIFGDMGTGDPCYQDAVNAVMEELEQRRLHCLWNERNPLCHHLWLVS
jgi:hypothetical protein